MDGVGGVCVGIVDYWFVGGGGFEVGDFEFFDGVVGCRC